MTVRIVVLTGLVASSSFICTQFARADDYGVSDEKTPPTEESAEEPEPTTLAVTGSFFTRYELREGYDTLGKNGRISEQDFVRYRARFGLRTNPIDIGPGKKVILSFEPQASGFWADKPGTLSDGAVGLHSATIRLQGDSYWLDAGRFEMVYGEHLVIGNVGWNETGRSFDGVRARFDVGTEGAWIDGFMTQVAEDPALVKPLAAGDQYFAGMYAGIGPAIAKDLILDGYVLSQVFPKTGGPAPSDLGVEVTVGARFKKAFGAVDVRAESGVQIGAGSLDQLAFQADTEVGMTVSGGAIRFAGAAWYASGDDPTTATNEAWDQLYPTAHKFLGLADIIGGRSNIAGGIARLAVKSFKSFPLGVDVHAFLRPQTADGVDAYTGVELDTWGLYKIGTGLGLRTGYSLFVPNESGPYGTDEVAHYLEVQLRYDLK